MIADLGIHNGSDSASIHPLHRAGTSRHTEEQIIEARIHLLAREIEKLNSSSRLVWLKTGPHIYNRDFDLSVKIEAVRWMLRIARHMNGSSRDVLMQRIQHSLDQLERALDAPNWSSAT